MLVPLRLDLSDHLDLVDHEVRARADVLDVHDVPADLGEVEHEGGERTRAVGQQHAHLEVTARRRETVADDPQQDDRVDVPPGEDADDRALDRAWLRDQCGHACRPRRLDQEPLRAPRPQSSSPRDRCLGDGADLCASVRDHVVRDLPGHADRDPSAIVERGSTAAGAPPRSEPGYDAMRSACTPTTRTCGAR